MTLPWIAIWALMLVMWALGFIFGWLTKAERADRKARYASRIVTNGVGERRLARMIVLDGGKR